MNAITELRAGNPAQIGAAIVHPTDFGESGKLALAHAVALALNSRARLTLLHIRGVDEPGPTRNGLGPVSDLLVRWGRLPASDRFADLQQRLGFSAVCVDVPARSVSEGVLAHFADHPIELAVLTTQAHSSLSYWFAGSLSRRLLRRADATILFIREGQRGFIDPQTGAIRLARALIPIDANLPVDIAIRRARRLIEGFGVKVEIRGLHIGVAPPPNAPKDIPLTLIQGPVGETILRTAASFRADLIIMPTAGKRGVLASFRNSVSAQILEDARWPVLSVPAIEDPSV